MAELHETVSATFPSLDPLYTLPVPVHRHFPGFQGVLSYRLHASVNAVIDLRLNASSTLVALRNYMS
jgi:hypothetical protein